MSDQNLQFMIPARRPVDALKERLTQTFALTDEGQTMRRRHFYDTFDWRLYRRNRTLEEEHTDQGRRLVLRALDTGTIERWVDDVEIPRFAADLRRGPFRDRLLALADIRALLPVAEIRSHSHLLRLRDDEEKTVARVEVELAALNGDAQVRRLPKRLSILPVRGHPKPARRLVRYAARQLELPPAPRSLLDDALAATGEAERRYTGKSRVKMKTGMRAERALRRILRAQLDILEANVPGACLYIDTEYLHDLRVAVRRSRSLLGQMRGVFDDEAVAPFRKELSWVGSITGPCRDLDVLLLAFDGYRASLEPELRPAIDPVNRYLVRQHRIEQGRLTDWLESPRFRSLLRGWREFLETPQKEGPDAERPIGEVAGERIWMLYRKISRRGRRIGKKTPAARLHRLRIHCKKLRYLLEAFRTLYPRKRIRPCIAAVKKLQNNLGDFHDYHVQSVALRRIAAHMETERLADTDTLGAIDALAQRLGEQQDQARRDFADAFAAFDRPRNRRNARKLFRNAGGKA